MNETQNKIIELLYNEHPETFDKLAEQGELSNSTIKIINKLKIPKTLENDICPECNLHYHTIIEKHLTTHNLSDEIKQHIQKHTESYKRLLEMGVFPHEEIIQIKNEIKTPTVNKITPPSHKPTKTKKTKSFKKLKRKVNEFFKQTPSFFGSFSSLNAEVIGYTGSSGQLTQLKDLEDICYTTKNKASRNNIQFTKIGSPSTTNNHSSKTKTDNALLKIKKMFEKNRVYEGTYYLLANKIGGLHTATYFFNNQLNEQEGIWFNKKFKETSINGGKIYRFTSLICNIPDTFKENPEKSYDRFKDKVKNMRSNLLGKY